MKQKFTLFDECGRSKNRAYAEAVLAGEMKIYAFIDKPDAFVLPFDVEDFNPLNWEYYHYNGVYRAPTWRHVFAPFGSKKWPDGDNSVTEKFSQEDYYFEKNEAQLLDLDLLAEWITRNNLGIETGLYELCDKTANGIAVDKVEYGALKEGAHFSIWHMMRIINNGECLPVAFIASSVRYGDRTLVRPEIYEFAKCAFCPADTVSPFMKQQWTDGKLIQPKGGDRLTEKLYDYANKVGREKVATKGFKDWLRKNFSDFDVSHGTISFIQNNGEAAAVNNDNLRARIFRLRHSK